ncbi:hypothetical protein K1719_009668 [Acacia pycnantha]|nr:hypothetical protein K1719_009668 [Acacia pycnantha]
MAFLGGITFNIAPSRVTSFFQLDSSSTNWSICVKVIGTFWEIPPSRRHKQITFNVVLADTQGYVALALIRRRDMIRRLGCVMLPGFCFIISRFTVQSSTNIINSDLKLVMEPFTKVEFVRQVIRTPDIIFQPLLALAATSLTQSTLINVVGLVCAVYDLTDVVINSEIYYQFRLEIMDESGNPFHVCFRGSPAFWAAVNYSRLLDKQDSIVALLFVKMIRLSEGDILFISHNDASVAIFNYDHPAVVEFRFNLNRIVAAEFPYANDSPTT